MNRAPISDFEFMEIGTLKKLLVDDVSYCRLGLLLSLCSYFTQAEAYVGHLRKERKQALLRHLTAVAEKNAHPSELNTMRCEEAEQAALEAKKLYEEARLKFQEVEEAFDEANAGDDVEIQSDTHTHNGVRRG